MKWSLRSSIPACAAMLFAGSASAGDIASMRSIGFSSDGQIFAYEEYGVQDGSGFPYANIYVLDLSKDTFLPGTPFRVRLENEGASVAKARWQVRNDADVLIETHEFVNHPAEILAYNPITNVDGDPHRIRYLSVSALPAVGEPNTLVLEESPEPPTTACEGIVERTASFRLRFTERDGKQVSQVVHDDEHIPTSRRCVTGYRLGGIMSGTTPRGAKVEVAMVLVLSAGFEGPDGRWIAVPIKTVSPDIQ